MATYKPLNTLFVCCFLLLVLIDNEVTAQTVARVVVVHRHGSRMPELPTNKTLVCVGLPCGALTVEGKDMLTSLGRTLRADYASLIPDTYDPYSITTRSTSITRTMQSADGFLRGLFPNLTTFYPVLANMPIENDGLLDPYGAWPSNGLHTSNPSTDAAQQRAVEEYARQNGIDDAVLAGFARENQQYVFCPDYFVYCIFSSQDLAESLNARGLLNAQDYPLLTKHHAALNGCIAALNRVKFQYNESDPYWKGVGSMGYQIATEIIGLGKSVGESKVVLVEYSAHDTTLVPLYSTAGVHDKMRPDFAEAIVFEILTSISETTIRARRGWPEQTPGPHAYTFTPFALTCIKSDNTAYRSTERSAGCTLADWERYIKTRGPAEEGTDGGCFNFALDQKAGCPENASVAPTEEQHACLKFRAQCPSTACADGYVLDVARGYVCIRRNVTCTTQPPAAASNNDNKIIFVGAGAGVGALIIGIVAGFIIGRMGSTRKSLDDRDYVLNKH